MVLSDFWKKPVGGGILEDRAPHGGLRSGTADVRGVPRQQWRGALARQPAIADGSSAERGRHETRERQNQQRGGGSVSCRWYGSRANERLQPGARRKWNDYGLPARGRRGSDRACSHLKKTEKKENIYACVRLNMEAENLRRWFTFINNDKKKNEARSALFRSMWQRVSWR